MPITPIIRHMGSECTGAVIMCCAGTLIDPNMIPISVATVSCLWFSSMYFITLLILINPSPAPTMNTIISMIDIWCITFIMYSYCPSSKRSDDPEIPGSNIAHIAMNPDINIIGRECDVCIGFSPTKMYASIAKIIVTVIGFMLNASNCLYSMNIDARISPAKNEYVNAA